MFKAEDLKDNIPVTVLGDWLVLQAGEELEDSTAALRFMPTTTSEILKEKAVASIAIRNNKTALWDGHGFANVALIMNEVPASADYTPCVDPTFLNYTVWELVKKDPDIVVGPHTVNMVIAALESYGYPYPPNELGFVEDYFLNKYGEDASKVQQGYLKARDLPSEQEQLACLDEFTKGEGNSLFIKYQVARLLAADAYLQKKEVIFEDWTSKLEE